MNNNDWPTSISKRVLWRYINQKIKHVINHYHVLGIMSILFDEILKDLKSGKTIKIFNFGSLSLEETKPRRYFDVRYQQVMQSDGHKILRFVLASKLNKKLRKHLDLDRTLRSG